MGGASAGGAGGGGTGRSGDPVPEVGGDGAVVGGGRPLEVAAVAEGDTLVKEAVATEVDAALEEDLAAIVDGKRLDNRKVRISKVVAAVVPLAFLAAAALGALGARPWQVAITAPIIAQACVDHA